jgi:hypothetical protein
LRSVHCWTIWNWQAGSSGQSYARFPRLSAMDDIWDVGSFLDATNATGNTKKWDILPDHKSMHPLFEALILQPIGTGISPLIGPAPRDHSLRQSKSQSIRQSESQSVRQSKSQFIRQYKSRSLRQSKSPCPRKSMPRSVYLRTPRDSFPPPIQLPIPRLIHVPNSVANRRPKRRLELLLNHDDTLQGGRNGMRTSSFSASDKLLHICIIFIDSPYGIDRITLWYLLRIGISGSAFRPFRRRTFQAHYAPFREKSQQREIIYGFSLKGWPAPKVQKKLADTLGSHVYSQAQISRWLARLNPGNISCLDEARPGRPLSILGLPLEHFLEKFPFASARIITVHFNGSHSIVKDILLRELGLQKSSRRYLSHQWSDPQKHFHVGISLKFLALLDQHSELQFEGIAIGDKS